MKVTEIPFSSLGIKAEEVYSTMRYGGATPEPAIREIVDETLGAAASIARPKYICGRVPARPLGSGTAEIGGTIFKVGGIIASYLEGMTEACIFIATAGREFSVGLSSLKKSGDILSEYVADAVGSVIAEECVKALERDLAAGINAPHSLPYSPGYCAWDIREQKRLFALFPDSEPCGVTLSESCLMSPEKSVSGFFAIGKDLVPQPYRCEVCTNRTCYKNRHK